MGIGTKILSVLSVTPQLSLIKNILRYIRKPYQNKLKIDYIH